MATKPNTETNTEAKTETSTTVADAAGKTIDTATRTIDTATRTIENATRVIESATSKGQERLLEVIELGQSAVVDGYEAVVAAAGKIDFPAVPAIPGVESVTPNVDAMRITRTAVDGYFDFAARVLASQRQFADRLLVISDEQDAAVPAKASAVGTTNSAKATSSKATSSKTGSAKAKSASKAKSTKSAKAKAKTNSKV